MIRRCMVLDDSSSHAKVYSVVYDPGGRTPLRRCTCLRQPVWGEGLGVEGLEFGIDLVSLG